jgi:hypothetical protein
MAKKPVVSEAKKPVEAKQPAIEAPAMPKTHSPKPGINPFVQQHPGKPGRTASGVSVGSRRNPR